MRPPVVLDTNVLVSAMLTPLGKPHLVVQLVLDEVVRVAWGAAILAEHRKTLSRPRFGFDTGDVDALVGLIEALGEAYEPVPSAIPLPDEDDRVFYDTALAADAILVSGNLKHYPPRQWIVSPAAYLASHQTDGHSALEHTRRGGPSRPAGGSANRR